MTKAIFTFIFSLMLSVTVMAQTDEQQVSTAVELLRKAMIDADKPTLEKLAADELSYGHSSGLIEDKATFVQNIVSGKSGFTSIELKDQTVSVVGDVAVVRHKFVAETTSNGQPGRANIGILLVWKKQSGSWKLLARQAFRL